MAPNDYSSHKWWKEAVVYQIYPASFYSTGSGSEPGWGDVRGITAKLDYLKNLGVDVVWISPIYKSPQVDMGYDIADYLDVDPRYGHLSDVDELIHGLHARGMKLMMDLVVNHTSDQHAWFKESRSSKTSAKRDWYIWQPAKYVNGERLPPNNWAMILGEANSAWTWDEVTQEYYLSLFTPEQPDLNWRNPAVREAVHDVLRFWLDRGASGFRMDVINLISKVPGYPDAPISDPTAPYQPGHIYYANGPKLHEYLKEMNEKVLSKYDTITVGEMPFVEDRDEILRVVGANEKKLNMIFIFKLVDIDNGTAFRLSLRQWHPPEVRNIVSYWQKVMQEHNGWNSIFIENHDNPRSVSRYCDDSGAFRDVGTKLLCLMQTTLSGTLYVYQGEELGMKNAPIMWEPEEYKDVETQYYWKKMNALYPDNKAKLDEAWKIMQLKARDHARLPVQWTAGVNAGFCEEGVEPWMRVNDEYQTNNADMQLSFDEPGQLSVFQFWRRALVARKKNKDVFIYGSFELLDTEHPTIFAYKRASQSEAFVIALNFSGEEAEWCIPVEANVEEWVAGNYGAGKPPKYVSGRIKLDPWEGILGMFDLWVRCLLLIANALTGTARP